MNRSSAQHARRPRLRLVRGAPAVSWCPAILRAVAPPDRAAARTPAPRRTVPERPRPTPGATGLPRGVWCVGFASEEQVVIAAIDGAGRWLHVATVPEGGEPRAREALRAMLDQRDPMPPEITRPALALLS